MMSQIYLRFTLTSEKSVVMLVVCGHVRIMLVVA